VYHGATLIKNRWATVFCVIRQTNNMVEKLRKSEFLNYRLSNDYIRGLTDGEGCFTFHANHRKKNGIIIKEKIPAFAIQMHIRDRWLLVETLEHLGIKGNVYTHKAWIKDGSNRGDTAKFYVRSLKELQCIVIPFFYKKLAGYKGKQFFEWLKKIGSEPMVASRYKLLYELYKSGYWENENNIPERLR